MPVQQKPFVSFHLWSIEPFPNLHFAAPGLLTGIHLQKVADSAFLIDSPSGNTRHNPGRIAWILHLPCSFKNTHCSFSPSILRFGRITPSTTCSSIVSASSAQNFSRSRSSDAIYHRDQAQWMSPFSHSRHGIPRSLRTPPEPYHCSHIFFHLIFPADPVTLQSPHFFFLCLF